MAEENELIYHYCGAEAFMNIMKSRTLWLTDLYQTNDAEEGREISKAVRAALQDENVDRFTITEWENNFNAVHVQFQGYGFCMSENGDLLSQWRGYAQDGTGFSIGLDRGKLDKLCKERNEKDGSLCHLKKVEYDIEQQKSLVRDKARSIPDLVKAGALRINMPVGLLGVEPSEDEKKKRQDAYAKLISIHVEFVANEKHIIKNAAFSEEREWRLYTSHFDEMRGNIGFFRRGSSIVPYYKFELGAEEVVKKIFTGPSNSTPQYALKMFLVSHGYENVEVAPSSAPYLPR